MKRALECRSGGQPHHGRPPGSGKTMLAKRLRQYCPNELGEALDVTKIHSVAGVLERAAIIANRPFRSPHIRQNADSSLAARIEAG